MPQSQGCKKRKVYLVTLVVTLALLLSLLTSLHTLGRKQPGEVERGGSHLALRDLEASLGQRYLNIVLLVQVCARGLHGGRKGTP